MSPLLIALKVNSLPTKERIRVVSEYYTAQYSSPDQLLESLANQPSYVSDYSSEYKILELCQQHSIHCLSFFDNNFPLSPNLVYDCPAVLFYKGDLQNCLANKKNLAIVGSRNCDQFGYELAKNIANKLSPYAVITSGLALGIDSAAHKGALLANQPNNIIAVLAHGLDQIYPQTNSKLAEQIVEHGGALVAQFPPTIKPKPHQFLIRNAIIAGLANAVLVVQAGVKSGSLATARHALESGKEVLAVPGRCDDPRFVGTNRLIQQGAHLVTNAEDIAVILDISLALANQSSCSYKIEKFSKLANTIIKQLESSGGTHYLDLLERFSDQPRIHEEILQLELDGIIHRQIGNFLTLAGKH